MGDRSFKAGGLEVCPLKWTPPTSAVLLAEPPGLAGLAEHPLGEVEALLGFPQLLLEPIHLPLERLEPCGGLVGKRSSSSRDQHLRDLHGREGEDCRKGDERCEKGRVHR